MKQVAVKTDVKLSGFVVTYNEERNIRECLESVSFCDELIVVDSHSTDRTREIAAECGARVIERDWPGYLLQKSFACDQCANDWVLLIDADERVTPELKEQILQALGRRGPEVGFELNRVNYFLGRWWRRGGWYPEYRLRLFRRSESEWNGIDPHEKVIPRGKVGQLHGELLHFSFADIEQQTLRHLKYAKLAAAQIIQSGEVVGWKQLTWNPIVRFFKFYFLKYGYREGICGLVVAMNEGFYTFLKYAFAWEIQHNARGKKGE